MHLLKNKTEIKKHIIFFFNLLQVIFFLKVIANLSLNFFKIKLLEKFLLSITRRHFLYG